MPVQAFPILDAQTLSGDLPINAIRRFVTRWYPAWPWWHPFDTALL
jgi:hypothetical protein